MEIILAHKATWAEPFTPSDDMLVYIAQRPLVGAETWEGVNRYGIHYAAAPASAERLPDWNMMNKRNDARLIELVDNQESLTRAMAAAAEQGRYTLANYVAAFDDDPRDGAREMCTVYRLPWHDADTSADAMIQAASE